MTQTPVRHHGAPVERHVASPLPSWAGAIRPDHPRLFFNRDTWDIIRERALGPERSWYETVKARVDGLTRECLGSSGEPRDLGRESSWAAFVYLVSSERRYMALARSALETSLRFYEACYRDRKAVNWYGTSRTHVALAWDWLYNDLDASQRQAYLSGLVQVLHKVYTAEPPIYRESTGGFDTGFYGVYNCKWFVGCTGLGTGIEEELTREWLVWGYDENMKMLRHRRNACGDDGGAGAPALGYAFGHYPHSEQNFLYTWLSASGQDLAPDWPHAAYLANYVIWNWIEAGNHPLEFGWGDVRHTGNALPARYLYTHMANIRHLYGRAAPDAAALAAHVQQALPERSYNLDWFIYPFLLASIEESPRPMKPQRLPQARHFENMGQIFMRSGAGSDDTYCLFTAGGTIEKHRHYDALNFVIYHKGHLALDSGTRYSWDEFMDDEHLLNYYAQTVAHNCVLIHQPGEPPAHYWGETVKAVHGGQHRKLGSVVHAFETNDDFVYVAADGTACYHHGPATREGQPDLPEKVSLVTRQLVFLMPNHFVIFDRVVATDASYEKQWLLHMAHEPLIEGRTVRADHVQGRMLCRTLLPEDAVLAAVGGPGAEFWADGRNWDIRTEGLTPEHLAMMGQWRVEMRPGAPRREELFLHVIQVGAQDLGQMDPLELLRTEDSAGVRLSHGSRMWEVNFNARGELGGRISLTSADRQIDRSLASSVTPQSGTLGSPV